MRSAAPAMASSRLRQGLLRAARAIVWTIAALAIAVGAAGVVQGAAHPPGDATRPELTARADALMAPRIAAFRSGLVSLQQQVAHLSDLGRNALVQMRARQEDPLLATLDEGDAVVVTAEQYASQLAQAFQALPYGPDSSELGAATRQRLATIQGAFRSVVPIASDWATVSARAVPAMRLLDLLAAHDQQTLAAVELGGAGKYSQALAALTTPLATLDQAVAIRDQLAAGGIDTTTLDGWVGADRAYDLALQKVYGLLAASHGHVTQPLRTAIAALDQAKAALPPDTRALVVNVGDIASGGLTQALVDIDAARGALTAAALAVD